MAAGWFRASVQYGDWEGTVSADDADQRDFRKFLAEKKQLDPEREMLVGVELGIGENHRGKVAAPYVDAVIIEGKCFDDVAAQLKRQPDQISVRKVHVKLTLQEFMGLFKRFSIVLTQRDMHLTDREYQWDA
jgi:hypothetical protein